VTEESKNFVFKFQKTFFYNSHGRKPRSTYRRPSSLGLSVTPQTAKSEARPSTSPCPRAAVTSWPPSGPPEAGRRFLGGHGGQSLLQEPQPGQARHPQTQGHPQGNWIASQIFNIKMKIILLLKTGTI